jgi:hypothetical protein
MAGDGTRAMLDARGSREMTRGNAFGIGPDPYIDVPLFESVDDLGEIERTRGICDECGELTNYPDETLCNDCDEGRQQ